MRTWMLLTIAGVLAVALVAASAVAVMQTQRASDERARGDQLAAQVEQLRDEVAELEDELEAARAEEPTDGPADSDEAAPGRDGGLDLDGMLEGLLGGSVPGQECFTPGATGGLDGLLDGLFGGGTDLPDDPDLLVEVISEQVAELRELQWQTPVDAEFLSTADLQDRLEALFAEDLDPAEVEASERLLVALGALPEGSDLERMQRDLLDEQIAGYYVPDTGELVVRVPDDGQLRPVDAVTLAHELDHALTDQVLGIPDRSEPPLAGDADATLGVLAVVEGDATLLMNLWALSELSMSDQLAMAMDPGIAAAQAALDDVPHYLQRELLYPYTEGLEWACQAWLDGGWRAIDAAYEDPPTTSAEVLWGEAVEPAGTSTVTAPEGFEELTTTTFGAAPLLWLLEAPGDEPDRAVEDAEARARAWDGGEVTVWSKGERTAVGLALVDNGAAPAPLCDTMTRWYEAAFPDATSSSDDTSTRFGFDGAATAAVWCEGDDVVVAIGPDEAVVDEIIG